MTVYKNEQGFHYVAGVNTPGYLPDSEPSEFLELEDARQFLVDEYTISCEQRDVDINPEFMAALNDLEDDILDTDEFTNYFIYQVEGPVSENYYV